MQRFNGFFNVVDLSKWAIENYVKQGDRVVDATLGNGHDALAMAKKIDANGYLYGFDIQEEAIENSKKIFEVENIKVDYEFILDSHSNIEDYITEPIDFGIMNLGYLPGGDKSIVTLAKSSNEFIDKFLGLLNKGGMLIISSYSGHDNGAEQCAIIEKLSKLNQKSFNVISMDFINQANSPAKFFMIEKSII